MTTSAPVTIRLLRRMKIRARLMTKEVSDRLRMDVRAECNHTVIISSTNDLPTNDGVRYSVPCVREIRSRSSYR